MSRSSNSHLFTFFLLTFFSLLFGGFLVYAGYKYFTDGVDMTIKSFAPGLPAVYLGFMARNEFRAMRAARKVEANRKKRALMESE